MANDVTHYTGQDWDSAHVVITIDGIAPNIFASSGDMFTAAWNDNAVTISVDAKGNGMRAIQHNGSANLTINISRSANIWQKILKNEGNYRTMLHKISISDDVEILTTTDATLQKLPDLAGSNQAPDAALLFECMNLSAEPQPNSKEAYNAQG